MVKGFGPHFARKQVRAFIEQDFDVIKQEPEHLLEGEGIGPKRKERVTSAWAEQNAVREIMVFLRSHVVGAARAVRIYKTYGERAADRLIEDLSERWSEMALFTLATGSREANVVGLDWSQVHLERECAWIHPDQERARKANPVPLNADAMAVIRRQAGRHLTRVFTLKGMPVTKANNHAWRKALVRAGRG